METENSRNTEDKMPVAASKGVVTITMKALRTFLLAISLVVLGAGLGYQYRDYVLRQGSVSEMGGGTGLDRENLDFSMFWEVWDTLHEAYLDPEKLDSQAMIYGAIQGMTSAIGDPYTVFLPPADNQQSKEDLNGEFDGVGIQLGYKKDTVAVMAPLEDHPAIKKGVKAGDLILHIKDEAKDVDVDTGGMTLDGAVKLIRGKKGTPVTLTLYREEKGTFEVEIVRDTIKIPSVELVWGEVDGDNWTKSDMGTIAHIKIRRFGENTQEEWDTAVTQLIRRKGEYTGIILDVRNNPGGYLNGAISLASDFIPEGVVVKQDGRLEKQTYEVDRRARLMGVPVVVLLNGGSASASEILAGALRDRIEAKLVGEKSFGKGTVQEALELREDAGLHVTTSRWLLPSGDWIHETGLTPDVEIELPDDIEATGSAELIDTQLVKAVEVLMGDAGK